MFYLGYCYPQINVFENSKVEFQSSWAVATNSNFLIPISLQPNSIKCGSNIYFI